ncbi:MAG: hypothetical protein ABIP17_00110 [Ilumatobacteraceae bacterium]
MNRRTIIISVSAIGTVAAIAVGGAVLAGQGADSDTPIQGDALTRASEVALDHMGGGRVTGTEVGDEDSLYEVEVTLDDGRQVDVQLDENFAVVSADADVESSSD